MDIWNKEDLAETSKANYDLSSTVRVTREIYVDIMWHQVNNTWSVYIDRQFIHEDVETREIAMGLAEEYLKATYTSIEYIEPPK